ncbi:hypothetical protein NIES4072_69980 [Nostoc commune NIES-4072]|uniref:Uncharacterized protein n=1 Tax=Nostoc commune NIES-4072 TaxID=2005467 RepID=A0A2R5FWZ2_NOSCO|nr:hypothetical protein NIES4070_70420 [Nostoc commune HK-02]GBG23286.1 hypothetical protein NIES4072_69980 [Nostoc commune NIES-4072]
MITSDIYPKLLHNFDTAESCVLNSYKSLTNLILFMSLGTIFWFGALLFIRFVGDHLFINDNPWLVFLFIWFKAAYLGFEPY